MVLAEDLLDFAMAVLISRWLPASSETQKRKTAKMVVLNTLNCLWLLMVWRWWRTLKELKTIWETEAEGKIVTWNQVNPKFPNERILLFAPPVDSGTADYFTQSITKKRGNIRSDYTPSYNQNTLIQGVIGNPNGFAFAGVAFFMQSQDRVSAVGLENLQGKECVKPLPLDNVKRNIYSPLTRPLFIYVSKKALDSKPSVQEFVSYFVDNSWKYVDGVGYVPLPDLAYVKTRERFDKRQTGSTFKDAKPGEPIINFL